MTLHSYKLSLAAQTFGRKLFINRNLRPDFRISQEGHEEELNVSVADLLDENPRIYQLPVGVRFSDDLNDSTDKSNIRSPEEINDVDIQMQASPVPSVPPLNGIADVGFDAVTDFWNSASVFLKRKKPNNSKKQGVLSTRAASMLVIRLHYLISDSYLSVHRGFMIYEFYMHA